MKNLNECTCSFDGRCWNCIENENKIIDNSFNSPKIQEKIKTINNSQKRRGLPTIDTEYDLMEYAMGDDF